MEPQPIICDACELPPHGRAAEKIVDELPAGWYWRTFGRRTFRLCDCCGSIHHFKGGISPYLQETLGLAPNAVCDFEASEKAGGGLHRRRPGHGKPGTGFGTGGQGQP